MKARFTVIHRVDPQAARLAFKTWASQSGATVSQFFVGRGMEQESLEGREAETSASVSVSRVWLDSATRWRHELTAPGDRASVVVVDELRWWCLLSDARAFSNAQDPSLHPPPRGFPYAGLLSPDELLEGLEVQQRRPAPRHGWKADSIIAKPGEHLHPDLPRGADRYLLELDVDHGVIRKVVASVGGRDFAWIDMSEFSADVTHSAETFVLALPPGIVPEQPHRLQRSASPPPPTSGGR